MNVGLGRTSEALDLLEQAYRERAMWLMFLQVDGRLASLRGNQRFEALAARMKIPCSQALALRRTALFVREERFAAMSGRVIS